MKRDLSKPWDLFDFSYRKILIGIEEEINKDISDEEMGWDKVETKDEAFKNIKVFNN